MIKVYNSLNFKKEEFKTIKPNEVLMYVCGPTVYDSPHLGHAKSAVTFDMIRKYFEFKGYNVKIIKNYTDIDDKIINRANELGMDYITLSEHYIKEYENIMQILNVKKDTKNPRATEVINFMIKVIEGLISKGYAYEKNGSVYYSVKSFPKYEEILQNIKMNEDDIEAEILEDQDTNYGKDKQNRRDFALWKKMKEGEPYWESPWGRGRPGWHIECSAMAIKFLGDTIDIHGGGQDLKFPHHRNEIAQSEAYTGKKFANFFIHNGFVNINNEKMSKSLDNFFLVSDIIKKYDPMVIRWFLISSHYRSSINYSLEIMDQAEKNYNKILNTFKKIKNAEPVKKEIIEMNDLISKIDKTESKIIEAMDDDFDTPVAIAEVMSLFREINQVILERKANITDEFKDRFFKFMEDIDKIFGIFPALKKELKLGFKGSLDDKDNLIQALVNIIADMRIKLRKLKLYSISDELREKLRELGISLEDQQIK
ncbi:MAG: cysteine--tRNA ligase [Promethearchaeota archaeon]